MAISHWSRFRRAAIAAALSGALSPSAVRAAPPERASQNSVQVYFYRTGALPIWNAYFYVDGEKVADLPTGPCKYTSSHLPAGTHSLKQGWPLVQMATNFSGKLKLAVDWVPHGIYYYNMDYAIKGGGGSNTLYVTRLSQVNGAVAAAEISHCAYRPPSKSDAGEPDAAPSVPVPAPEPSGAGA
jgi:hypothetical protein